jgi:hypothetical protein
MKCDARTKKPSAQAAVGYATQDQIGNLIFLKALGQRDCDLRHLDVADQKQENGYR